MHEKHQIFARLDTLIQSKIPAALATVVSTTGSTYRRPSARLLVTTSENVGAVSAGCLEDEVIKTAKTVIRSSQPQLLRFDTTEEMDAIVGSGLGCRGTIEVFIEPIHRSHSSNQTYSLLQKLLMEKKTCALAFVIESRSSSAPIGKSWLLVEHEKVAITSDQTEWDPLVLADLENFPKTGTFIKSLELGVEQIRIYAERIEPTEELVIFGAGFDAQPLAKMAIKLGFDVIVIDHRPDYLLSERFPGVHQMITAHPKELSQKLTLSARAFAVVMTHNYLYDRQILQVLLESDVQYIGQIGPRSRTEELLEDIEHATGKLSSAQLERLHGPIGLDLGAETPEEIALSIMSEITAFRNGRRGGHLRERKSPIHEG